MYTVCGECKMGVYSQRGSLLWFARLPEEEADTQDLWSLLVQLFLAIPLCIPYSLYRAFKDCRFGFCCEQGEPECWKPFEQWFEHRYYKFVNHTTWYMVFLAFLIAASFEDTFGRFWFGLEWIGEKYPLFFSLVP